MALTLISSSWPAKDHVTNQCIKYFNMAFITLNENTVALLHLLACHSDVP